MKKNYYTIAELLVVIAIMAVVVGFAIPAVSHLVYGNRIEQGIKNLSLAFDKARAEAIVNSAQVALLLPVRESTNYIRSNYLHRSYAIIILRNGKYDVANNGDFKWQLLPGRTFFSVVRDWDEGDDYFKSSGDLSGFNTTALSTTFNLADNDNIDGTLDAKAEKEYKKIFKKDATNDKMAVRCMYFNPDGTISEGELSFFVMQGFSDANGKLIVEDNGSDKNKPANALGIKLNRLTGRVRYYETLQ